ncbi:MAG: hypothetical protein JXR84_01160 [Anaerolineae bacterium]|nr:hypothetical protein [Anaerolineae bacterium]
MKICKFCGKQYLGWMCECRRRSKRGGRPRSIVSLGGGSRKWRLAQAQARMLGGWGELQDVRMATEGYETSEAGTEDENLHRPDC